MQQNLMEQLASPENLLSAWRAVRGNVPKRRRDHSRGPDGVSLADFERELAAQISTLQDMLLKGRYQPTPAAKFKIPKRGGGQRIVSVLTVRDRVSQRATQQILEPIWEPVFLPCSYGYRPGLSVEDAAGQVTQLSLAGKNWIVDGDIQSCFDSLDHDLLAKYIQRKVHDLRVVNLIYAWLDAGVLEAGYPQEVDPGVVDPKAASGSLFQHGVDWAIRLAAEELGVPLDETMMPKSNNLYPSSAQGNSPVYEEAGDEGVEVRRRMLRKMTSTGVALGASWAAPAVASLGKRAAAHLSTPAGRRAIKKGALVSGGLAVTAAAAAAAALLLKRKAGPAPAGILQGSPLSPLLANIYLHPFDKEMTRRKHQLVRYADDWVLCCPTQDEAEKAYNDAITVLSRLRLKINPEKTHILAPGEGLDWLGMRIR